MMQAAEERSQLSPAQQAAIAAQQAAFEAAAGRPPQARPHTPPPVAPQQPQPQPEPRPNADDAEFDDATRAAIAASLRDLQASALQVNMS